MPVVVWCTGPSGAGKTTLAKLIVDRLHREGTRALLLDGDELRETISAGLRFSPEDRSEHVRRIARLAKAHAEQGTVAVVATMSPLLQID